MFRAKSTHKNYFSFKKVFLGSLAALSFQAIDKNQLFAQGASAYSLIGLGDALQSFGAVYDGIGGTSVGVRSEYGINQINPAAWSGNTSTRIMTNFQFRQFRTSNVAGNSLSQNDGYIQSVMALLSIDTAQGISVSLGLRPVTKVAYSINQVQELDVAGTTETAVSENIGSGGLSTIYLGASWKPLDFLAVGLSANHYFGQISQLTTTTFYNSLIFPSQTRRLFSLKGTGFQLGVQIIPVQNLTIGVSFAGGGKLLFQNKLQYVAVGVGSDTSFVSSESTSLPTTLGIGASYRTGKFLVAADYVTQNYSDTEIRQPEGITFGSATRYSLGVSRLQNRAFDAKFFDSWAYNFGVGMQNNYISIGGTQINEVFGSFGVQVPIGRDAFIDFGATLGLRGEQTTGLLRQEFARFSFGISIGDNWFKPFKRY